MKKRTSPSRPKQRKPRLLIKEVKSITPVKRYFYESRSSNGNLLDRSTEGDSYPGISGAQRAFVQHTQARLKLLGLKPFKFTREWWLNGLKDGSIQIVPLKKK